MHAFRHLLVPTDFGECAAHALDVALDLAAKLGAKVTLVHAMAIPTAMALVYAEGLSWPIEELDSAARRELQALTESVRKRYPEVEGRVISGEPREAILALAKEVGADVIVMGTHGRRGLPRAILGSVAERVVRTSPIPVLTIGPEGAK